jgi:hypothetical protein
MLSLSVDAIALPPGAFVIGPQTLESVVFNVSQLWNTSDIPMLAVHYHRRNGLPECDIQQDAPYYKIRSYNAQCFNGFTDVTIYVYLEDDAVSKECDACTALDEYATNVVAYKFELSCIAHDDDCDSKSGSSSNDSLNSTSNDSSSSTDNSLRGLTEIDKPALSLSWSSPASADDHCSTDAEVAYEDFEAGFAFGWEGGMTDSSSNLTTFLGRLGQADVSKSFEVPPDAIRMTMEFLLYEIDDWDEGDRLFLEVCSTKIDLGIFESNKDEGFVRGRTDGIEWWRDSKGAPEDLGFRGELDQIHRVVLEIPRSCYAVTGLLKVVFSADLIQEGAGIDNLKLAAHYKCVDSHPEEDEMAHMVMPTYLQSLSTAPVGSPKKDKETLPQSRQTVEATKKLDEVALEKDPADCDDMTNAILEVPVEGCTTKLPESPIEIVSRGVSSVTFTVSQVWHDCENGNEGWLATDFITTKGDLECFKTEGGSICPTKVTHTASCDEGAVVVDLYAYDDHFFENNRGQVSVPMACRPSGDRTKMCHYRYILQCTPKKCEDMKPFRLFGMFGF